MKKLLIGMVSLAAALNLMAGEACCSAEHAAAKAAKAEAAAAKPACDKAECPAGACEKGAKADGVQAKTDGKAEINTATLSSLIGSGHQLVILDARTAKYDDGNRIAGATLVGPELTAEAAAKLVAAKDSLVVTYCGSVKCPLSHKLAENLKALGYSHVLIYKEGIAGWVAAGNPVAKVAAN